MTEPNPAESIASARVASGVLFFDAEGRILLVRPSYKPGWELPGGYVEIGETPVQGAVREVQEELGIKPPIGALLVADRAPAAGEGDKLLFVFDGGELAPEYRNRIELEAAEIAGYAFHDPELVDTLLIPRLARRVKAAIEARSQSATLYLEHGEMYRGALPN
ncbi:NUDIX domain-containing protein [Catenulispora rubra]|uniref:NUDIX domain-containing protein n=1 Tax=Catenulispora rubra TaxID=280293 RepID=UPI0018923534|nr:NUDIX hydrolase [Catenulispora rubra]